MTASVELLGIHLLVVVGAVDAVPALAAATVHGVSRLLLSFFHDEKLCHRFATALHGLQMLLQVVVAAEPRKRFSSW